jgi:flagellar hook-associated protein 1 FlgK
VDSSAAPGGNNSLLDQRDAVIQSLSQLVNVQTVNQGNGSVNVYIGSEPLVMGTSSRGLTVTQTAVNGQPTYQLNFATDNGTVPATGGQLGALLTSQTQATATLQQLNSLSAGLISAVNDIHASGQGTEGFTSVTGTNQVLDPTAALNSAAAGLTFPPKNGSFVVHVTNTTTGLSSSTLVPVTLTGSPNDTTLNSLVSSLNGITGVQASVVGGMLQIQSTDPNSTISFSQDSSNTLAGLGINTFFQGDDAQSIAVNSTVANNTALLAAGQNGNADDNTNALALANAGTTAQSTLGGNSVQTTYTNIINTIAANASNATNNAQATLDIRNTLQAQHDALSGVSINEEAINLIKQQQAFQGAARLISTIDQMMTTLFDIT